MKQRFKQLFCRHRYRILFVTQIRNFNNIPVNVFAERCKKCKKDRIIFCDEERGERC
jgi:hypothetical protein